MNTDARILVTGAGGFIGGWLVEAMHLAGYKNMRAGIRRWSSAARIGRFPIEIVPCDIMNKEQVGNAMEGIDTVIHCAFGMREVMVQGTQNMLEASLGHGVRRFINFSTVDVYGDTEGIITEETPLKPMGKVYGDSKIEAEKICLEYNAKGLPVVILRPSIVYGPFAKLWISKFAERIQSGNWGIFKGVGDGTCNLVYIEDMIRAVLLSLDSEQAVGQAFNINGSDLITWNEYFTKINDALGLPPLREIAQGKANLRTMVMTPIKKTARFVLDHYSEQITSLYRKSEYLQRLMKRTERSMKSTPSSDELGMYGRKPVYDISKAQRILGFKPAYPAAEGVAMSIRWLKHEAFLTNGGRHGKPGQN